jgi:hypothetical protein
VTTQRHPGAAALGSTHPSRDDVLDPVAVGPVRLEQLAQVVVVTLRAGQGIGHVSGDVVIAEADRVRVAMRALANLGRCPSSDTRQAAKRSIGRS